MHQDQEAIVTEQGYSAYWDGTDYSDNPYAGGTDDHDYWAQGWLGAEDEVLDARSVS